LGRAPGTDQFTAAFEKDTMAMEFPNVEELQLYFSGNKKGRVRAISGEGLDIPIWILGSSTESASFSSPCKRLPCFESFCSAQLLMQ
jgi:hypothetical protein